LRRRLQKTIAESSNWQARFNVIILDLVKAFSNPRSEMVDLAWQRDFAMIVIARRNASGRCYR